MAQWPSPSVRYVVGVQSAKLENVSETEWSRSIFSQSRNGVGVKNFRLRTPLLPLQLLA